jgi:hypothetical protein
MYFCYMMLKCFLILLLAFGSTSYTRVPMHPLYVSITDATFNAKENSIEIISKIFLDDLESVLKKQNNVAIDLFAEPNETNKNYIVKYLQKHLQYIVDGKVTEYTIIGYERKKDACWVYLEISNIKSVKNVVIHNNILHDFTEKQMNLIHFSAGSTTKSHKFTYPEKTVSLAF